jgi:hypothetical protein
MWAVLERRGCEETTSLTTTAERRRQGRELDNGGEAARRGGAGEAWQQRQLDEAGRRVTRSRPNIRHYHLR